MILPTNFFTFLSDAHGSTSWIDYCASTSSAHKAIESIKILHEFIISDHRPFQVTFICNKLARVRVEYDDVNTPHSKSINWEKLTQQQKKEYAKASKHYLCKISIPNALDYCANLTCNQTLHQSN